MLNKLIKINKKWFLVIVAIILIIAMISILVLFYKIEKSFSASLIVKSNKPILKVQQNQINKFINSDYIDIRFENNMFHLKINAIQFDKNDSLFNIYVDKLPVTVFPNSTLRVSVIYDQTNIWNTLFHY